MKKKSTLLGGKLLLFAILFFQHFTTTAQFTARTVTTSTGTVVAFLQGKPKFHDLTDSTRRYPLIIYLHGGGDLWSSSKDTTPVFPATGYAPVWELRSHGVMEQARKQDVTNFNLSVKWNNKTDTFIVLQPLSPAHTTWPPAYVDAMIKYGTQSLKGDTNRIFLCGHSYGGAGVFNYLNISSANAKKLAAVAETSAWNTALNSTGAGYVSNAKLPVWGFHALNDTNTAPAMTINSIAALNAVDPAVKPLITLWPAGMILPHPHHHATRQVFLPFERPYLGEGIINIYEWFLGQNNDSAVNTLPVARAGNDTTIAKTPGTAILNASLSTDVNGKIVRYVWKKLSGPAGDSITKAFDTLSSTTVTGLTVVGQYTYQLNVVDNRAAIARDTIVINVVDSITGYGKALKATGQAGRVYTNADVTQLTSASKFTLEAQVKIDSTASDWTTIMRKGYNASHRIMFHVGPGDNSIHCIIGSGTNTYGKTGPNAIAPGSWYHLAFVYDGTQTGNANRLKLYINGVQQTLDFDGTTIPSTTSSLLAGQAFMAGANLSSGTVNNIDEVRVWGTALSGTTINDWKDKLLGSCHPNIANLAVYWPLNNSANPASAPAGLSTTFNGTVTNASYVNTTLATDTVPCPGKGLNTTAAAGRVYTNADVTQLTSASKFTLEAQVKIDSTASDWTTIMRKGYNASHRIMFHVGPGDNSIHCIIGSGTNTYGKTGANAIAPGSWYHLAFVYDGTQTGNVNRLKLYINGVQQSLDFDGTTIPSTTSSLLAGQAFMAGANLSAGTINNIDEVRVWGTALSDTTINDWKDKLLGSCHPNIANLAVYWPLNNSANPASAPAGLSTTFNGTVTNANYVSTTVASDDSNCGSPAVLSDYTEEIIIPQSQFNKLYPNPTHGPLQLELNSLVSKSVTVHVIDMYGKYVYRKQASVVKGSNRLSVNISSLRTGNYIIDVRDGNATLGKFKVVKQ